MLKILKKLTVAFVTIFVLTNANIDEIKYESCSYVANAFEKGPPLFDKEDAVGEYLARNGFLMKRTDPFAGFWAATPPDELTAKMFYDSNRALRGTQVVFDATVNNNTYQYRPDDDIIESFLGNISSCVDSKHRCKTTPALVCDKSKKYRSIDGSCNNLKRPFEGTPLTPYWRILPASYEDAVLQPRRSVLGVDLPSPRHLSDQIFTKQHRTRLYRGYTPNMAHYFFGQIVTHDLAGQINMHHRTGQTNATRCCSSDYKKVLRNDLQHYSCMAFEISDEDQFHKDNGTRCHNYIRSQPIFTDDCKLSAAQQANTVTQRLDLSPVYGSDNNQAAILRTFKNGKLKTNDQNLMMEAPNCPANRTCFVSGDLRSSQTPYLAVIHVLFLRIHNIIADLLYKMNPDSNDETLYQEARRITIALYQKFLYEEYLPILFDSENLLCDPPECDYESWVPGTASNEFFTATYRYMHVFCPETFKFYGEDGTISQEWKISQSIGKTNLLKEIFKDISRGLIKQSYRLLGISNEMRNAVFGGVDLFAIDIQRGRDHGIPRYVKYIEFCFNKKVRSFKDLNSYISMVNIELLKKSYGSVNDIDLLVGGALETKRGKLFGSTFTCLAEILFRYVKIGDRFFYTNKHSHPNPFTELQLEAIRNISFAQFMCITSEIKKVPANGFLSPSYENEYVDCSELVNLDLTAFKS